MSHSVRMTLDVTAIPAQLAGAGRYVYELASYLATANNEALLISRSEDAPRWAGLVGSDRVIAKAPAARPLRLAWEQLKMPGLLNGLAPELHHGPHYTLPKRAKAKKVVTVHDMTFFDYPQWHEKAKVHFFRRSIESSVKQAAGIVAVSNYTAERMQERFGELPVTVISHGVDHDRFKPSTGPESDENDRKILSASGITGDFVACVGTIEPRKNVPALIKAFEVVAVTNPEVQLVIAGKPGWGADEVEATIAQSKVADRVIRPGYLPAEAIPALLRQARVVAYPSLVEGFGLPALEALACGAVLITTTGSAMQEVVGDAALLIPPGDDSDLTEALRVALSSDHQALRARGPQVAAGYTWDACGDAHMELYRTVASA